MSVPTLAWCEPRMARHIGHIRNCPSAMPLAPGCEAMRSLLLNAIGLQPRRPSEGPASKNSNPGGGRPYFHVSDFHRLRCLASAVLERELDGFAHTRLFDLLDEVRQAAYRLAVRGHDDVAQFSG